MVVKLNVISLASTPPDKKVVLLNALIRIIVKRRIHIRAVDMVGALKRNIVAKAASWTSIVNLSAPTREFLPKCKHDRKVVKQRTPIWDRMSQPCQIREYYMLNATTRRRFEGLKNRRFTHSYPAFYFKSPHHDRKDVILCATPRCL